MTEILWLVAERAQGILVKKMGIERENVLWNENGGWRREN